MKILVCCGHGLGSSFMIEMSIKKILKEIGVEAEVSHSDLSSAASEHADIYVGTRDIATQLVSLGVTASLDNLVDRAAMKEKIIEAIAKVQGK